MKAQSDEGDRRILLGGSTGGGAVISVLEFGFQLDSALRTLNSEWRKIQISPIFRDVTTAQAEECTAP